MAIKDLSEFYRHNKKMNTAIMTRFLIFISVLLFTLMLLFNSAAQVPEANPNICLKCHQDVYMKAISYRYQHSVVKNQCPLCHIIAEEKDNTITRLNFPTLQEEWILYLDKFPVDTAYKAEVAATDGSGRRYSASPIDINPSNIWMHNDERSSLKIKKLSGVTVDDIERRGFARAVISWDTDVFATSEVEYRLRGERPDRYSSDNIYMKEHQVILDGLKHKKTYYFRVISRDIYGNALESKEYTFDTSDEYSRPKDKIEDNSILPIIENIQVFRRAENKGLYLKVSVNKSCEISVTLKEVNKTDNNHDGKLSSERFLKLEVCYKCHTHDSSHPVGIKALSPKTRTPDGLPTIEDGIITCVTCHEPHGGQRAYYNRFDFRKDLCMRCHLERYGM